MKFRTSKRFLSAVMALVMLFTCLVTPAMAAPAEAAADPQNAVTESADGMELVGGANREDPNRAVTIMVRLEGQTVYQSTSDLQAAAVGYDSHASALARAERSIEASLSRQIEVENSYSLLFNGFSFVGESWMIEAINELDGISAYEAPVFELVEPVADEGTDLTPDMGTSTELVSANMAWELGFTGEGLVIAVVDTGIRQTHKAFSAMPENGKIDMAYLEEVYANYGDQIHAGSDLENIYYNEKLPFNWDYFDGDAVPNHTASDHGTHVAGIAAGNNGSDFKGTAPDAQIVTMQVFTDSGGASWSTILAALEDCVYLGVDAINMSLGSPAGFTSYESAVPGFEEVYTALEEAGISVAVAAGNDANSIEYTNYGPYHTSYHMGLSSNPDTGLVGAPSTYPGSFSVASVVNSGANGYVVVDGANYYYGTVSKADPITVLAGKTYELVYVKYAKPADFEAAGDMTGKIAFAEAGGLVNDNVKCQNAEAAGAAGIIIYKAGTANRNVTSNIPVGTMGLPGGKPLLTYIKEVGRAPISVRTGTPYENIPVALSSSWGTTSDLRITPDIAAPGDNIRSATGSSNSSYEAWNGTSMATPHVSAGLAMIKQRLRTLFPDATASEINELGYTFAMSTAHPIRSYIAQYETSVLQLAYVRQQGAGLIDLASALTTEVYLSVPDNSRPKLELDESEDGTFSFTFDLNNVGSSAHTYNVKYTAVTEQVSNRKYSGTEWGIEMETVTLKVFDSTSYDVTELVNVTGPETVTVEAGESVTVEMTIECSEELMAYFEENFPSGMYLEGHVQLIETDSQNPVDLSIPYLGFVGDWDYASMLDRGYYWMTETGEQNLQQLVTSNGNFIGYMTDQGLGINQYADMHGKTYLADRNAISPNGDGMFDAVSYLEYTLLRNAKSVKLYVEDAEGNVLTTLYNGSFESKDYFNVSTNGDTFHYINFEYLAEDLAENDTVYLVFETWLDHEGYDPANNESGRWVIPVTKDLTAPAVKAVDGGIQILDENYIAYYAVYADEAKTELLYETGVFAEQRGVAETYETEAAAVYVATADYAGNEQFYKVEDGLVYELDADGFWHGRQIIAQRSYDYVAGNYDFEWVTFQADLPGTVTDLTETPGPAMPEIYYESNYWYDIDIVSVAAASDGTLYGNTKHGVYILDHETFDREEILKLDYGFIDQIMMQPNTDQLYGVVRRNDEIYGSSDWVCQINVDTGEIIPVFMVGDEDYVYTNPYTNRSYTNYEIWAITFIAEDQLAIFSSKGKNLVVIDMTGQVVRDYEMNLVKTYNVSAVGVQGFSGNMLYDEQSNCVYIASDWSWFGRNRFGHGGIIRYDLDTETTTLNTVGQPYSQVLSGMFFMDSTIPENPTVLTDFELDQTSVEIPVGRSTKVNVIRTPEDANTYTMQWTSSDESVATVNNNRKRVTIEAVALGTATITATAYDPNGEVIAERTVEVTVGYDQELKAALNVEDGVLEFISGDPYPFVVTTDEASGRAYAVSTNAGMDESESRLTMTTDLYQSDMVSFEYMVSSETDFDFLYLYANGEEVMKAAGEVDWSEYTFTAPTTGTYTFDWVYVKDPAVSGGSDLAAIDNVAFTAGPQKVIDLIGAIGQVTLESGEAIEAARQAYEALDKEQKAGVENYQELLDAEHEYVLLQAEYIALISAKNSAQIAVDILADTDTGDYNEEQLAAFEAAISEAREAIDAAATVDEVNAALENLRDTLAQIRASVDASLLDAAKADALLTVDDLVIEATAGLSDHQVEDLRAAVEAAREAIAAAADEAEVEAAVQTLSDAIEVIAASCPASEFTDVDLERWYHEAVDYAVLNGLMNGIGDGLFAPDAQLTRGQLVTILYRLEGSPSVDGLDLPFADVAEGRFYTDAVIWAADKGIIKGVTAEKFAPEDAITREQAAAILYRYAGAEPVEADALKGYDDGAAVSAYAKDAMNWAVANGLINGTSAATLAPQDTASRAQIAAILMRCGELLN